MQGVGEGMGRKKRAVIEGLLGAGTREEAEAARAEAERYQREHPTDMGVLAALERLDEREDGLPANARARRVRRRVRAGLALVAGALCTYLFGFSLGIAALLGVALALEIAGWTCAYLASRSPDH